MPYTLPPALMARWLHATDNGAQVDGRLARLVRFQRHNLPDRPPGDHYDAVVCRTVRVFFEPEVAASTLVRLAGAVAPGGYLLLGPAELPLAGGWPSPRRRAHCMVSEVSAEMDRQS